MRDFLKVVLVLVFAASGVFAFSLQTKSYFKAKENSALQSSQEGGKSLYLKYCARCHGADGKGQTAYGIAQEAPDFSISKPGVARSIRLITRGGGSMPAFNKKLTRKQINVLARYVSKF